ncbi:MAG: hypothetical protein F6K11_37440 [Leptolyngbya sp. SIO3F4]|nr:hypothetical protein [Leptolyngbya sp. SIO3F4]
MSSFSPDGNTFAIGSNDSTGKTVKLFNRNGQLRDSLVGHSSMITSLCFSSNNKNIVVGCQDDTLRVWNLSRDQTKDNKHIQDVKATTILGNIGHTSYISSVSFSPDNKYIATASNDRTVKLWDLKGNLLSTLIGHLGYVSDVSFSPDGQTLASSSSDGTIKLWDQQGNCLQTLKGHRGSVASIRFSADGQTLVSGSFDRTIKLWKLEAEEKENFFKSSKTIQAGSGGRHISLSPPNKNSTGQIIASDGYKLINLWDLKGNHLDTIETGQNTQDIAFSPDGKALVLALQGHIEDRVKLYERPLDETSKEWKTLWELKGFSKGAPSSVRFSPKGKNIIVVSDYGKKIQLVASHTGNVIQSEIETLERDRYSNASFSPDGKMIIAADSDYHVQRWEWNSKDSFPSLSLLFHSHRCTW